MLKITSPLRLLIVFSTLSALIFSCGKQIGDDCSTSLDCEPGQLCDVSYPGGYCTVFSCSEDICPEEAVCIEFVPMFYRNCMLKCTTDGDCRKDYRCISYQGSAKFCGVPDEDNAD